MRNVVLCGRYNRNGPQVNVNRVYMRMLTRTQPRHRFHKKTCFKSVH